MQIELTLKSCLPASLTRFSLFLKVFGQVFMFGAIVECLRIMLYLSVSKLRMKGCLCFLNMRHRISLHSQDR